MISKIVPLPPVVLPKNSPSAPTLRPEGLAPSSTFQKL
jgi:hypothetical protein